MFIGSVDDRHSTNFYSVRNKRVRERERDREREINKSICVNAYALWAKNTL